VIARAAMFAARCLKACSLRRRYGYTWTLAWAKAAE